MRKAIFIIAFASLYLLACNGNNRKEYTKLEEAVAKQMSLNYKRLIASDVSVVIQQIVVDQKQLGKFTAGSERVKLIAAAYDVPRGNIKTTIIIQIGTRENGKPVYTYFDFREVFKPIPAKADEDGDNNTICPPPDNCGFPLAR